MLPLRSRLDRAAKESGKRLQVIERDYLLSWVLRGIYQHQQLRTTLVFKGGTALKKCYFGKYRFSEDIDFSATNDVPPPGVLGRVLTEAIQTAERQASEYAPMRIVVGPYEEREPHPFGQEAFEVRAQFPWQRSPVTVVMIEVSRDELLVLPSCSRPLIHEYGEPMDERITAYSLEEIVVEKLRAILQHTKKLHERDWGRSRARDYYDLWSIFGTFGDTLHLEGLTDLLHRKCAHKNVRFQDASSFFNEKMLSHVRQTWVDWLGPLVADLPACEVVINDLGPRLATLLP